MLFLFCVAAVVFLVVGAVIFAIGVAAARSAFVVFAVVTAIVPLRGPLLRAPLFLLQLLPLMLLLLLLLIRICRSVFCR